MVVVGWGGLHLPSPSISYQVKWAFLPGEFGFPKPKLGLGTDENTWTGVQDHRSLSAPSCLLWQQTSLDEMKEVLVMWYFFIFTVFILSFHSHERHSLAENLSVPELVSEPSKL